MKKIFAGFATGFLVFTMVGVVDATLIDLTNGVIQDDRGTLDTLDDRYWIQDLNRFVGMTYDEQITAISGLDNQGIPGITGFHMASYTDILSLLDLSSLDEITAVFTPTPHPTDPILMWRARTARFYADYSHYTYLIDLPPGEELNGRFIPVWDDSPSFPGAWAVAYAAAPVPEPATMLLFGTGLAGLVGGRFRRKRNNNQ